MTTKEAPMATDYEAIARRVLDAWNAQDVERLVACYTPDLVYRDPGTHGTVHGADAFRRYLTRLFAAWEMHWAAREILPLERDGVAVLWHATLAPRGTDARVDVEGMDLVRLEGDRIKRNDTYFDRVPLAALPTARPAA
jgi:ketosteroid isomerase-like protein